jgi:hypothetical protein
VPNLIGEDPVTSPVGETGGWDNSAGEAALAFTTTPLVVFGCEQVALYVTAGATSGFATGPKLQNSNDGTNWADVVDGTDGLKLQVGTIALADCNDAAGPAVAVVTPKVGKWIPTKYLRFAGEVAIAGVVTDFVVEAVRWPTDRPLIVLAE